MKGSVLIVDFEDRDELDEYLNNEPYILESVWERVEVQPMNATSTGEVWIDIGTIAGGNLGMIEECFATVDFSSFA